MRLFTREMHSSGGYPGAEMAVTVQTASAIIGKSPSVSVINHSWFSSLKRPLRKKFGKSHTKEVKAEYANCHQHYSINSSKSRSAWDVTVSESEIFHQHEGYL